MEASGRIRIFTDLPDEVYREVESKILWRDYPAEAKIVSYKEQSTDVYFIKEGYVRVAMYSYSGKEVSYQNLCAGEMFGELSAMDELPRSANVFAINKSRIGSLHRDDFMKLVHTHPVVATAILLSLTSKIRSLTDRVYQHGALGVKDRLRKEILRLAHENMTGPNSAVITGMPKHTELASRINTHRETVTRELNSLFRMGLIHQKRRVLTVYDIDGLSALVSEA